MNQKVKGHKRCGLTVKPHVRKMRTKAPKKGAGAEISRGRERYLVQDKRHPHTAG